MEPEKEREEREENEEEEETKRCVECGMEEREWQGNQGRGYRKEGEWCCCEGCAEDVCPCGDEPSPDAAKSQTRSRRRTNP